MGGEVATSVEHRLARVSRPEALSRAEAGAVGLLPVGSLEQHGEHMPIGTDSILAEAVCLRAASKAQRDILVAPAIWTGFSPHHARFGATVTLSAEAFVTVVRETVAQLTEWLPFIVVVNGHGGNRGLLAALTLEGDFAQTTAAISYWELASQEAARMFEADHGSIGHAGQTETSMMLAEHPEHVGEPSEEFVPVIPGEDYMFAPDLGTSGVIGDARAASGEAGEQFLDAVSSALAEYVDAAVERQSQARDSEPTA